MSVPFPSELPNSVEFNNTFPIGSKPWWDIQRQNRMSDIYSQKLVDEWNDLQPTGVWFVYCGVDEAMFVSDDELIALRWLSENIHFSPNIIFWEFGMSWDEVKTAIAERANSK